MFSLVSCKKCLYLHTKLFRSFILERLGSKLYRAWNNEVERCREQQGRSPSLIRAGAKVFWWQITLIGIVEFIEEFVVR